jgi:hypothetical protein
MSSFAAVVIIAIGAIATWGVSDRVDGVAFDTIGYIVMAAGAVALAIALAIDIADRRPTRVERERVQTPNSTHESIVHH